MTGCQRLAEQMRQDFSCASKQFVYLSESPTGVVKNFTRYSALFLLLLLARVMTPNELLLRLHAHEHTQERPHDESKTHIGQKHTHCNTDNLFHAPFQP